MAAESGSENFTVTRRGVEARLFSEPYCFEFFQAVRLLQLFYPARQRIGYFHAPATELVRLGVRPSLAFPPSELYSLSGEQDLPQMRVNFMGLVGPAGQMPHYYTELVAERLQQRDRTLQDFFDIFHHRAISLFYRAWEKYRFLVPFERGEGDRFSDYLLSVIGLGAASLRHRQLVDDQDYLYYGGLLAQQPRTAEGLELMLADFFGVPAKVDQLLGAWYRLDSFSQCALDDSQEDSQQLGFGAVVGDEIWDPQSHARIVLGPLSLADYRDFLPTGTAFQPLKSMLRFYAGDELDFELQLVLRKEETPPCLLGGAGPSPQLGWLTWAKTQNLPADPNQTVMQL